MAYDLPPDRSHFCVYIDATRKVGISLRPPIFRSFLSLPITFDIAHPYTFKKMRRDERSSVEVKCPRLLSQSLYPSVATSDEYMYQYPIGEGLHLMAAPDLARFRFCENRTYWTDAEGVEHMVKGVMQLKLTPPREDLFPFVTTRIPVNSKSSSGTYRAVCPLCYTCAVNYQTDPCHHSDSERAILETLTTDEIAYALTTLNYSLVHIYEAFIFFETAPLFKSFLNVLARDKIVASGLSDALTPEEKQAEVDSINRAMNFTGTEVVKVEDFSYNEVQRCCAKLASKEYPSSLMCPTVTNLSLSLSLSF